jgi:hypothetical protein
MTPLSYRGIIFSVAIPLGRAISHIQRSTVELTSGLALTHPSFLAFNGLHTSSMQRGKAKTLVWLK